MPDALNRPRYHFMPPSNWMNDPNGLIQWRGLYHLFYQYNPDGAYWGNIHWGHAVSSDLVNWEHLPVALAPDPLGPDRDGCWSGVIVEHDNRPVAVYTAANPQTTCLAFGSPDLVRWEKYAYNPVIASPPPDLRVYGFRDHTLWKQAGMWYQLIGSGTPDLGGTALLYRSADLIRWEYLRPFCSDRDLVHLPGYQAALMWECPDYFRLQERGVLIISAYDEQLKQGIGVFYLTGEADGHCLMPQSFNRLDWGGDLFYAPQSFTAQDGRRIQFGWIKEDRSITRQIAAGWSGAMSLPRELGLHPGGGLSIRPASELRQLRRIAHVYRNLTLQPNQSFSISDVHGAFLEIFLEFDMEGAARSQQCFDLALRATLDGSEQTLLTFAPDENRLILDRSNACESTRGEPELIVAPFRTNKSGVQQVRVFLDGSILEIFINDAMSLTSRVYPDRPDSVWLRLTAAQGGAHIRTMTIWQMDAATYQPLEDFS